ncbi:hypothetical protein BY458DRAFT_544331 [Sporodiniella umbellata]|nr:hypothetical protein BY458DRAFT_544331 [Sporodiniella umbellata]
MDYISYILLSDYCVIDDQPREQTEDASLLIGDIEKINDFDSASEISKVNSTMEIDPPTKNLKIVSINNGSKNYKKYRSEQIYIPVKMRQDQGTTVPRAAVYASLLSLFEPNQRMLVKIKSNIKRNPLDEADTLTSRLPSDYRPVIVKDCKG